MVFHAFPAGLKKSQGFTLVEMTIVLVVIGVVIMIVYPALNAVRTSTQRSATDNNLQALMRATAVFVQANGCLPCPTPANTIGNGFGRVRGAASGGACGACTQPDGIPPFASLGIPMSMGRDGWGRWITMRVDSLLTVPFGVVPPSALCTAQDVTSGICTAINESKKGLCKGNLLSTDINKRISVQIPESATPQYAAVIFVSHGQDGGGAYAANGTNDLFPFPSNVPVCNGGRDSEQCNGDHDFVFFNGTQGQLFDDSLLYLDRNNLVSLFGNGSCQTAW